MIPVTREELQEAYTRTLAEIVRIKEQIEASADPREKRRLLLRKRELQYLQLWHMDQSCPGEEALAEVERLTEAGYSAQVAWLTESPVGLEDEDGFPEPFDPCEAIIVNGYLGKYNLVKIL